mgnify:FL=1
MKSLLGTLVLLLCTSMTALAESQPVVSDAWVREAPPGARMLAAYLTIENTADEDLVLVDVSSPQFAHVMMHRSVVIDGMARMTHEDSLIVPAGTKLELKPGSYHLMMPAPDTQLVAGDPVLFVLQFSNGSQLEVHTEVRKP